MTPIFQHVTSTVLCEAIRRAKIRVIYCSPGLTQEVAAALIAAVKSPCGNHVQVVLDVSAHNARMGYGQFDGVTLLGEHGIFVRQQTGLRISVLVVDDAGYAFSLPPMLVEDSDGEVGMRNAIRLSKDQIVEVVNAVTPPFIALSNERTQTPPIGSVESLASPINPPGDGPSVTPQKKTFPEIGLEITSTERIDGVSKELEKNPPQKFDLARKLNVFNALVEFVDMELTGTHIERRTVKLPNDLVLATRDANTSKRVQASFKLIDKNSRVVKDAQALSAAVENLRTKYLKSIGSHGTIIVRHRRKKFEDEAKALRVEIDTFSKKAVGLLNDEIAKSIARLMKVLLPALKKRPPKALTDQLDGKPTPEHLQRYLDDQLVKIFPDGKELVGEMKLEYTFKGVTYETLSSLDFQEKARKACPLENFSKPFEEFGAVRSSQKELKFG